MLPLKEHCQFAHYFVAMPGIKRRVDSGNDRDGKRAKVKDAASSASKGSKKDYRSPAFQKKGITRDSGKMNKDKKLAKASQKKGSSKKAQKDEEDDSEDSEDSDSVDDSDIEMDDEQDAIEEDQEEEAGLEEDDAAESSGNGENSNNTENSRALFLSLANRNYQDIALTLLLYL